MPLWGLVCTSCMCPDSGVMKAVVERCDDGRQAESTTFPFTVFANNEKREAEAAATLLNRRPLSAEDVTRHFKKVVLARYHARLEDAALRDFPC